MKKNILRSAVALLLCASIMGTSCIGSFQLTNRLLGWNKTVGNKFINELVFFAFWILPVYEVTSLADILVLNSIEFWSGRNPMGDTASERVVESSGGEHFLVKSDADGYDIRNLETEQTMRLDYDSEDMSWNVEYNGERHTLFTFVDDTHVRVPVDGENEWQTVELSQAGLFAYRAIASPAVYAAR